MLARHIPGDYYERPRYIHRALRHVPDRYLYRLLGLHPNWYDRTSFGIELEIGVAILSSGRTLFHFLYGEHSFRWTSKLNRWMGHRSRVVASYHQLPHFFEERRTHFAHVRDLDAVILVSSNQRKFFDTILEPRQVHVIPHGIDTQFFQPSSRISIPGGPYRILTVGSNYRDFEVHTQLICNINRSSLGDVEFVVVGEPRCARYFAGLDNVRYLHGISDKRLLHCYQSADLLLLPLSDATACNALLEGMACGLPIVVTDVGGVRDYVDDECAMLVLQQDEEVMTQQVLALLKDEKRRTQMGRAARQRAVTQFDWHIVAGKVIRIYASVEEE